MATTFRPGILWWATICVILALLISDAPSASASVIGVDYGTEWFKVSLLKSGSPLDIVLNKESKRKTASIVLVRADEREYGGDAASLATRFPQDTYRALKNLLGKRYDDPIAEEYRNAFGNAMVEIPGRGTIGFKSNEDTIYTVEELVAMQLAHAKSQAEVHGGEKVTGAVITVPPQWSHFERQALMDAADLAGLRTLMLMNDETAVALNYATGKTFTQPQYHIFFDMGAGSTVATLVKFHTVEVKKNGRTNNMLSLEVQAVGFDPTLGGHSFDARLQQHLAEEFKKKYSTKLTQDVFQDSRAMARLLKEAARVKQILSANQEIYASVEGVMEELDFRTLVTRSTLEKSCEDLFARVSGPVNTVLSQANLTVADINSVVLVGGSVRIPGVQAALIQLVGDEKIAKNVNGDEAAVMGAGLQAARLSTQFRVKEMKVQDLNPLPIEISYQSEPKENGNTKEFHSVLFNGKSVLGAKKLMNFKRESDFEFELAYTTDKRVPIVKAKVSGVAEAFEKVKDIAIGTNKVRSFIELNPSGIVSIGQANVEYQVEDSEKSDSSFKDKVLEFFKAKKSEDGDGEAVEEGQPEEAGTEGAANETAPEPPTAEVKPQSLKTESIKLQTVVEWQSVPPMSVSEKVAARERLAVLDRADSDRRAKEEARNELEAFVYRTKEFLYDDVLELVSTDAERATLKEHLDDASDWIYDGADQASTSVLKERLQKLKDVHEPLRFKHHEHHVRDTVVTQLKQLADNAKNMLSTLTNLTEAASSPVLHTEEDIKKLSNALTRVTDWLAQKMADQSKLALHEKPVLLSSDITSKTKELQKELNAFIKSAKPKPKPSSSATSSETWTATTSDQAKPAESSTPPVETPATSQTDDRDEL
ncbi:Hsp70 protein-domain-containing protein [Gaertneriomyces semiglobifer]|nr:Hsp70 protein-domain-containing protein [Gaertneriomyces semiglobifer]